MWSVFFFCGPLFLLQYGVFISISIINSTGSCMLLLWILRQKDSTNFKLKKSIMSNNNYTSLPIKYNSSPLCHCLFSFTGFFLQIPSRDLIWRALSCLHSMEKCWWVMLDLHCLHSFKLVRYATYDIVTSYFMDQTLDINRLNINNWQTISTAFPFVAFNPWKIIVIFYPII